MKNLLILLFTLFLITPITAQINAEEDDCWCGEDTVLAPGETKIINTKLPKETYTVVPGTPGEYGTRPVVTTITPKQLVFDNPNCPTCPRTIQVRQETDIEEYEITPPVPPSIVKSVTPGTTVTRRTQIEDRQARWVLSSGGKCNGTVPNPDPFGEITTSVRGETCGLNNTSDGVATVRYSVGFSCEWFNGSTNPTIDKLSAGSYKVKIIAPTGETTTRAVDVPDLENCN